MKLKNKPNLLNELIKEVEIPIDFIYCVTLLQHQEAPDVAAAAGMPLTHYYVLMAKIRLGNYISNDLCVKLSKGLDLDPSILNKKMADYSLKTYLKNTKEV